MAYILKKLYDDGEIDNISLDVAVNKRWITEEEKQQIIAG